MGNGGKDPAFLTSALDEWAASRPCRKLEYGTCSQIWNILELQKQSTLPSCLLSCSHTYSLSPLPDSCMYLVVCLPLLSFSLTKSFSASSNHLKLCLFIFVLLSSLLLRNVIVNLETPCPFRGLLGLLGLLLQG
jgi:hypothetical protein